MIYVDREITEVRHSAFTREEALNLLAQIKTASTRPSATNTPHLMTTIWPRRSATRSATPVSLPKRWWPGSPPTFVR